MKKDSYETPQNDQSSHVMDPEYSEHAKMHEGGEGTHHKIVWILLSVLVVLLTIVAAWYFIFMEPRNQSTSMSNDTEGQASEDEVSPERQFQEDIGSAGQLARSGEIEAALAQFKELAENAPTKAQEGQAKLNLGVWRLERDQVAAIELLKEVSLNELYAPFTRAKAANYVLNQYVATYDETLALEHVFTGPVWGDFVREDEEPALQGVANGFEFSMSLTPTPEASSRLAQEYAIHIIEIEGLSQEEKDQLAQQSLDAIEVADEQIRGLVEEGGVSYGETDFTEIAGSYNRKGKALDILYFQGYIQDPTRVEEAFQDGLNIILENEGGVGTELYLRYFYADFLVRLDAEGRSEGIQKILAPMDKMNADHGAASFFRSWIGDEEINELKEENDLARPDNMVRLAQISPEFKEALIRIGVSEEDLSS